MMVSGNIPGRFELYGDFRLLPDPFFRLLHSVEKAKFQLILRFQLLLRLKRLKVIAADP